MCLSGIGGVEAAELKEFVYGDATLAQVYGGLRDFKTRADKLHLCMLICLDSNMHVLHGLNTFDEGRLCDLHFVH